MKKPSIPLKGSKKKLADLLAKLDNAEIRAFLPECDAIFEFRKFIGSNFSILGESPDADVIAQAMVEQYNNETAKELLTLYKQRRNDEQYVALQMRKILQPQLAHGAA